MKLFFVTREPDNWSDGDLRIVDPEAAAYSNTLDAANEAERLARTYPGERFIVFEGIAKHSLECEPVPVVRTQL
ncbi:hypothetical protein [Ochrobactrum chromiisoli]|uniref:Uncharacterized protein n=1 Tax=Ochrobactrum chromiisoli TaxID=2993941 RepID=A0ABT3QKP3_9HYPH|nr:hypothetical protein [Ochrobactrum chromiisoli]MCX2696167.1 hypothetical protein [Ochrobactrum chromiisoli]